MDCDELAETLEWDRKNYSYPDLPKGYQITQARTPLARSGKVQIDDSVIRITSLHLEEDSAKTTDVLDQNRAGVALAELVTEPARTSGKEAAAYVRALDAGTVTNRTVCLVELADLLDAPSFDYSFRPVIILRRGLFVD